MFGTTDESELQSELESIRDELAALAKPKTSWGQGLLVLAVSMLVFTAAGTLGEGMNWAFLGSLVVVIFLHEMGHLAAMWAFDYQDLRMFFIPFFGAAASGRKRTATASQRAIVSLMGPLPGIFIGIGLGLLWIRSGSATAGMFAALFLALNVLNLLPVMPLDGGRFFDTILFSRWPGLQFVVSLATGALLLVGGFSIGDWILMGLGAFLLLGARTRFKVARLGRQLREELSEIDRSQEQIPDALVQPLAERVISEISLTSATPPKIVATYMDSAWQGVHNEPPRIPAALGLLAVYGLTLLATPIVAVGAAIAGHDEVIVEAARDDDDIRRKVVRLWDTVLWESELDADGAFHGVYTEYAFLSDVRSVIGRWDRGFRDGTWRLLGPDGAAVAEADYAAGVFQTGRVLRDGAWSGCSFEELPSELQNSLELRQEEPIRVSGLERRDP